MLNSIDHIVRMNLSTMFIRAILSLVSTVITQTNQIE